MLELKGTKVDRFHGEVLSREELFGQGWLYRTCCPLYIPLDAFPFEKHGLHIFGNHFLHKL
jgi:hypothetical protein